MKLPPRRAGSFAVTIAANLPALPRTSPFQAASSARSMHDTLQGELYAPTGVGPFPAVVLRSWVPRGD